jgi:GrpB-like predicted nucleotidyltransferase (UPF0157 family)
MNIALMLLHPHQPHWATDFLRIQALLLVALDGLGTSVLHVGSTAVPGLAAKPILDIDIAFPVEVTLVHVQTRLAGLGYAHVGDQGIAAREVFKRIGTQAHPVLDKIAHHLYACPAHSRELARHLAFRDHLIAHPEARQGYEELKQAIAAQAGQDRKRYAALKETAARAFIEDILAKAIPMLS